VASADDRASFEELVREYISSLPFSLDFQDVERELAALGEEYGPPGGAALLALLDGEAEGCVGVRSLEPPEVAELKRMYVRPKARGHGLGRALTNAALASARRLGYERVRLDTVAEMKEAARLYESVGFVEIGAYRHNPIPTARYYEVELRKAAQSRRTTAQAG
jgi:putative acetyltransferase